MMRPLRQHGQLYEELINIPRCVNKNKQSMGGATQRLHGDDNTLIFCVVLLLGT